MDFGGMLSHFLVIVIVEDLTNIQCIVIQSVYAHTIAFMNEPFPKIRIYCLNMVTLTTFKKQEYLVILALTKSKRSAFCQWKWLPLIGGLL
jgi:hypothetical protein